MEDSNVPPIENSAQIGPVKPKARQTVEPEGSSAAHSVRWRGVKQPVTGPAEKKRRRVIAILSALFACGLGVVAGLLSLVQSTPSTYVLPVWLTHSRHQDAGIHGPVLNDCLAIGSSELFAEVEKQTPPNASRSLIMEQLSGLSSRSASQPVMVYISSFAAVDSNQKPFLISPDSDPADPLNRIYLDQIFEKLKQARSKNKLLVLDVSWPFTLPELGIFNDDVSSEILKAIEENDDSDLICINSCSHGQVGSTIVSPRRTTFGFFFEQALLGAADGYLGKAKNGRVSVHELAAYLSSRVDDYSLRASPSRQTPVLRGDGGDFNLIACSQNKLATFEERLVVDESETPFPEWLASAWRFRDEIVSQKAWQISPEFVRDVENSILQSEMNWRRGEGSVQLSTRLESSLNAFVDDYYAGSRLVHDSNNETRSLKFVVPGLASIANNEKAAEVLEPVTDDANVENQNLGDVDDPSQQVAVSTEPKTAAEPPSSDAAVEPIDPGESVLPKHNQELVLELLTQVVSDLTMKKRITPAEEWPAVESELVNQFVAATAPVSTPEFTSGLYHFVANSTKLKMWHVVTLVGSLQDRSVSPINVEAAVLLEMSKNLSRDLANLPSQLSERASTEIKSADGESRKMLRIQKMLRLIAESERSVKRAHVWDWLATPRIAADDQRYVAEKLLWHPGYASLTAFDQRVRSATENFAAASALERNLNNSFEALEFATWRLPQLSKCNEMFAGSVADKRVNEWKLAAKLAALLRDGLHDPQAATDSDSASKKYLSANLERMKKVNSATVTAFELRSLLNGLLARYQAQQTSSLLDDAAEQPSSIICLNRVVNHLTTPFADCETRVELSNAAIALSVVQHKSALAAYNCPAAKKPFRLDQETQIRFAQQAHLRAERNKEVFNQLNGSFYHQSVFCPVSFEPKRTAIEKRWQYLASFYGKLGQDSPLGTAYQGLAQYYRNRCNGMSEPTIRMENQSVDSELTFSNRKSTHEIAFHHAVSKGRISTASNAGIPATKRKDLNPRVFVIPCPSRDISVASLVNANGSTLELEIEVDPNADPVALSETKGLFVEFEQGGQTVLHRVDLPGLANEHAIDVLIGTSLANANSTSEIRLRPSAELQPTALFVRNSGTETHELKVVVQKQSAVVKVNPNETRRVELPGAPPKPDEPLPKLANQLNVEIFDTVSERLILQQVINVQVAAPQEYVEVVRSTFTPFDGGRNRLEVVLQASRPIVGPDCQVELVLDPARIPGLRGVQGGLLKSVLPRDGKQLVLYAENLQLEESIDEVGAFEIAVDGMAHTFAFAATFARQGAPTTPTLISAPSIRIAAPKVGLAGPDFPVVLETLNAPTGSKLNMEFVQLGVQLGGQTQPDRAMAFTSPRETRIGYAPDGAGNLVFSAEVNDWSFSLNGTGLNGARQLVARLSLQDSIIGQAAQSVSLDDRPPRYVRFQNLAQQLAAESQQAFVVEAISETTGIESVQIFIGKPEEGKVPPKAVLFDCENTSGGESNFWETEIKLPKDPNTLAITAVATNGAGLITFETRSLDVVAADSLNVGGINGTVFEGVRPQPELEVTLFDMKGKVVATTKTKFDGKFEFQGVAAGNFIVESVKPASRRKGALNFKIIAGQTASGDVLLKLR